MAADPNGFDYWKRGFVLTDERGGVASTAGFDYWKRGFLFPAAISQVWVAQIRMY